MRVAVADNKLTLAPVHRQELAGSEDGQANKADNDNVETEHLTSVLSGNSGDELIR